MGDRRSVKAPPGRLGAQRPHDGAGIACCPALGRLWTNAACERIRHETDDNPKCHVKLGYDEEFVHLGNADTDLILMPSVYEPCGLTQMIAMEYGCVPIV